MFLFSAVTIARIPSGPAQTRESSRKAEASVWSSVRSGLVYVRNDAPLLAFFLVTGAITLLTNGPFSVGVPVLADTRFTEGAAAFGIIMSAVGGGSLTGTVLAGALPKPAPGSFAFVLLGVSSFLGIGMAALGLAPSTALAAVAAFLTGTANGYVVILFITWVQHRTPPELLGRMMSLLMFAMVGLNPISAAVAGALIKLNTTLVFVGAGSILVSVVLVALFNPSIRDTGPRPTASLPGKEAARFEPQTGGVSPKFGFAKEQK